MMKIKSLAGGLLLFNVICSQAMALDSFACSSAVAQQAFKHIGTSLPLRGEPANRTSGRVPHVQSDAVLNEDINDQLRELAFGLPGVDKRPTIASLRGALGMWLKDGVPVQQPRAIVAGREFSHIHPDGSLHAPLPLRRANELVKQGWGEIHPWADRFDGWEGLVMLFSPRSESELAVVFQLVVESYLHITGQNLSTADC